MPGPFHGINTASTALRAFQRAMDTIGHNMANVNTRGYSRQTVEMQSLDPSSFWSYGRHAVGSGVAVTSIARARADYLSMRQQLAQSDLGRGSAMSTGLSRIEQVYNEPGDLGIANALDQFFNGWSGLASNPSDQAARLKLRNASQTLTDRIRTSYSDLERVQSTLELEITATFDSIDSLSENIAQLNSQIRSAMAAGETPNDLLDQRDLAIQDLSKHVNITTTAHPDGSVSVYLSNAPLVSQAEHFAIPRTYNAATGTLTGASVDIPLRNGELMGHFQALSRITSARGDLDTLANTLRTQVNAVHMTGTNADGNTNVRFFNDSTPQTGAADFNLDPAILASLDAIATGVSGDAGDGGLALSLSQLRETRLAGLGNRTISGFYRDAVGSVSQDAAYYRGLTTTYEQVALQVEEQIQSVSGVSLDDEMADLMRFQRSYQAAARVLTVLDEVAEDLVNLIR